MKHFVKAMDKNEESFAYLRNDFQKLHGDKIKLEIFVVPQIRRFMEKDNFDLKLKALLTGY